MRVTMKMGANLILYQILILVFLFNSVTNQRTYKRGCECEYTRNGKCALTLLTSSIPESSLRLETDQTKILEQIASLQTELSRLSTEILQLKSQLMDTQNSLQLLQMDTGSVMSDIQSIHTRYGLCLQRGILNNVDRKVSSQWNSGTGASSVHVYSQSAWCPDPNNTQETFTEGEDGSAGRVERALNLLSFCLSIH